MALQTLRAMAAGGIHDQLGGGFARYSVDATWTVPHFEKMLYDNALLARAYLHGWQVSGDAGLLQVCRDTLDWALREMRGPEGGFYSALDADSEGVEGRYLRVDGRRAARRPRRGRGRGDRLVRRHRAGQLHRRVGGPQSPEPGLNVLEDRGRRPDEASASAIRARLLEARERRVRPGLDDKRLTSWNALMIAALAEAGAALREWHRSSLEAARHLRRVRPARPARRATDGCCAPTTTGRRGSTPIWRTTPSCWRRCIALFEATCEERWFTQAIALADTLIARFADPERRRLLLDRADGEALIVRRKDLEDTPIPAGGSSAALGLLRLSQLTGDAEYERHAVSVLRLLPTSRPATQRRSVTCCRRCTGASPPRDRSPARCQTGV